jgi:hypothetical protein
MSEAMESKKLKSELDSLWVEKRAYTIPPFTEFSSYCHCLKARIFTLYDLPYSSEPMEVEYLGEIFGSVQGNVVHRSTFVFLVCTGEIQCLVPEALFCQLDNIAAYILQLVYHLLEQPPNIAPTINRKVAAFDFSKQPCILELADVKKHWEGCGTNHRESIIRCSVDMLVFCSCQKLHFSMLHKGYMDLKVDSLFVLQSLAGTLDVLFREGKIRSFTPHLQKACLPYFASSTESTPYLLDLRLNVQTHVSTWRLPKALEFAMFPVLPSGHQRKEPESSKQGEK